MARQLRTSFLVLVVLAAVLILLGIGLCGRTPSGPEDFSAACSGALLLLVALILAVVAFARGLFRKTS